MSQALMPFLYQTMTIRKANAVSVLASCRRLAHSSSRARADNNIPFHWDQEDSLDFIDEAPAAPSTITPSEAEIFKGIFDDIAQGKVPSPKRPESTKENLNENKSIPGSTFPTSQPGIMARSIVEQARVNDFREKILTRYPKSLRNAAQVALGLYEHEPAQQGSGPLQGLDNVDEEKREERARYDRARATERQRVDGLMARCATDAALWKLMEKEVFSLPGKLGITDKPTGKMSRKPKSKKDKGMTTVKAEDEKRSMDVHGPLYPHYISEALNLFDRAFTQPSPYLFKILPRVRELGLPSYVLGVSTPFYARLARIHWERFGDATSALDVIEEMHSTGLDPDEEVAELLANMRDHLHGCNWGAQGSFVMAMMDSPPYDGLLSQRLESAERRVRSHLMSQD